LGLTFGLPFIFLLVTRRVPVGYNRRLTTLLLLGGFQGVIGWWMVKSGLSEDATVSQYRLAVHLGTALVIFSLLVWTGLDLFYRPSRRPRGHTMGSLLLIAITILAGALVAGMDAGLLYNEYPLMGNGLLPIEYGDAGYLDAFENPASAQFHHRWIAALTFAAVIALGIRAWRGGHTILGGAVIGAVTVQFLLGIATLLHGVPRNAWRHASSWCGYFAWGHLSACPRATSRGEWRAGWVLVSFFWLWCAPDMQFSQRCFINLRWGRHHQILGFAIHRE